MPKGPIVGAHGVGNAVYWTCSTCHWSHPARHSSCTWCDKQAAAKSAPAPPSNDGIPKTPRRRCRWGGKGSGKGFSRTNGGDQKDEDAVMLDCDDPAVTSVPGLSFDDVKALASGESAALESIRAKAIALVKAEEKEKEVPVDKTSHCSHPSGYREQA